MDDKVEPGGHNVKIDKQSHTFVESNHVGVIEAPRRTVSRESQGPGGRSPGAQ